MYICMDYDGECTIIYTWPTKPENGLPGKAIFMKDESFSHTGQETFDESKHTHTGFFKIPKQITIDNIQHFLTFDEQGFMTFRYVDIFLGPDKSIYIGIKKNGIGKSIYFIDNNCCVRHNNINIAGRHVKRICLPAGMEYNNIEKYLVTDGKTIFIDFVYYVLLKHDESIVEIFYWSKNLQFGKSAIFLYNFQADPMEFGECFYDDQFANKLKMLPLPAGINFGTLHNFLAADKDGKVYIKNE